MELYFKVNQYNLYINFYTQFDSKSSLKRSQTSSPLNWGCLKSNQK